MKTKFLIASFIIAITLFNSITLSQVTQQWAARHTDPSGSILTLPKTILSDNDGNVFVKGSSTLDNITFYSYLYKYSPGGVLLWEKNSTVLFGTTAAAIDGNGNVCDLTMELDSGYISFILKKFATDGSTIWTKVIHGASDAGNQSSAMRIDGSGNIYLLGDYYRQNPQLFGYKTYKVDPSGNLLWESLYNERTPPNSEAYLEIDASLNVYIGVIIFTGTNQTLSSIVKYNSSGVQQWVRSYSYPAYNGDFIHGMSVTPDGSVYATGQSHGLGGYDYLTLKYNTQGVFQWLQKYDGNYNLNDYAFDITTDASGNAFVTGTSGATGTVYDYVTIKYTPDGNVAWLQRYDGTGHDEDIGTCIRLDTANNVYVTGGSNGGSSNTDFATVKYNSSGVQQWVMRYNGPGNLLDYANAVAIDKSGNVIVAGRSQDSSMAYQIATVKYSQTIGIRQISSEVPKEFSLFPNYPNPFNPTTKIKFAIPKLSGLMNQTPTKLVIYDVLGKQIAALVDEKLRPGTYETDWDATKFASGLYFYSLVIGGNRVDTRKMILIK